MTAGSLGEGEQVCCRDRATNGPNSPRVDRTGNWAHARPFFDVGALPCSACDGDVRRFKPARDSWNIWMRHCNTVHPVAMHTHWPHEMGVGDAGQDSWRGRGWCATEWRVGIAPGPNVISRAGPSISPGRSFGHICTDGRYVYMYVTGHVRPIAPVSTSPWLCARR